MEVFQQFKSQSHVHDCNNTIYYHLQDGLLYKLDKLCVPKDEKLFSIREDHTSKFEKNFVVDNIVGNL